MSTAAPAASAPREPPYTRGEVAADVAVHAVALAAALVAVPVLLDAALAGGRAWAAAGAALYLSGLLAMLGVSALYNTLGLVRHRGLLRALDHSAIFLMIAGTYSPFALAMGGTVGFALIAFVWSVAALGIAARLLWPRGFDRFAIGLYLALGWTVVVAFDAVREAFPGEVVGLVIGGGLLYSVGVVFHRWRSLRFQNAIWHGFVAAAAAVQFGAVYLVLAA